MVHTGRVARRNSPDNVKVTKTVVDHAILAWTYHRRSKVALLMHTDWIRLSSRAPCWYSHTCPHLKKNKHTQTILRLQALYGLEPSDEATQYIWPFQSQKIPTVWTVKCGQNESVSCDFMITFMTATHVTLVSPIQFVVMFFRPAWWNISELLLSLLSVPLFYLLSCSGEFPK